jgi:predicted aspartyl protease
MTYKTIDYDNGTSYAGGLARETVTLHGPGGLSGHNIASILAVVDTGANFMHLPTQAAQGVGIVIVGTPNVTVSTANGQIQMWQIRVDVEIRRITRSILVNFANNSPALIGIESLKAFMDALGFDHTEWLIKW